MNKVSRIVFLNGVGSAGKSSLARALQQITREPFLHVAMDAFLDMLPAHLFDHPDGFAFKMLEDQGKPSVEITTGPAGERLMRGMRRSIAAMAAEGNNLIVDEVLLGGEKAEYRSLLAPFTVHWIGVLAPLDVLEAREGARGDRMHGLARWQYDRVHRDMDYDLEIDTSRGDPATCAALIKQYFDL